MARLNHASLWASRQEPKEITRAGTARAPRILLYVLMALAVIAVVGIALQYYPGAVVVQVLSLLPAAASVVHVLPSRHTANLRVVPGLLQKTPVFTPGMAAPQHCSTCNCR